MGKRTLTEQWQKLRNEQEMLFTIHHNGTRTHAFVRVIISSIASVRGFGWAHAYVSNDGIRFNYFRCCAVCTTNISISDKSGERIVIPVDDIKSSHDFQMEEKSSRKMPLQKCVEQYSAWCNSVSPLLDTHDIWNGNVLWVLVHNLRADTSSVSPFHG